MSEKPIIRIIGIGGAGSKIVTSCAKTIPDSVRLITIDIQGVETEQNNLSGILQISEGHGDLFSKKSSAIFNEEIMRTIVSPSDLVILVTNLGGVTGTTLTPVLADFAMHSGAVTLAIVTLPFSFEGSRRAYSAQVGLEKIKHKVDSNISIYNDHILTSFGSGLRIDQAFRLVEDSVKAVISRIIRAIIAPGLIKIDFSTVKSMLQNGGTTFLSAGSGVGPNRARLAAQGALTSPLIGNSLNQASRIFWCISGDSGLSLTEVNEAAAAIEQSTNPNTNILFDVQHDEYLKETVEVTILATAFPKETKRQIDNINEADYYARLGNCLKMARLENRRTQKECASVIGLTSCVGYSNYENGKRQITLPRLMVLADYLNRDIAYLAKIAFSDEINIVPSVVSSHRENLRNNLSGNELITNKVGSSINNIIRLEKTESVSLVNLILSKVADYYQISIEELLGKNKERRFTLGRQIACYLIRNYLGLPFSTIGEYLKKDASTVFNAYKKVVGTLDQDKTLSLSLRVISGSLGSDGQLWGGVPTRSTYKTLPISENKKVVSVLDL
jgi:cell division protein FtsZ